MRMSAIGLLALCRHVAPFSSLSSLIVFHFLKKQDVFPIYIQDFFNQGLMLCGANLELVSKTAQIKQITFHHHQQQSAQPRF